MKADFSLSGYRCFPRSNPARFAIGSEITAFVGPNNSGKSSILRFFWEFRNLFKELAEPAKIKAFAKSRQGFGGIQGYGKPTDRFSNVDDGDLDLSITLRELPVEDAQVQSCDITILRRNPKSASLRLGEASVDTPPEGSGNRLSALAQFFSSVADSVYVGPARHASETSGDANYFDVATGRAFVGMWSELKTGPDKNGHDVARRVTEDIRLIFDMDSLEINAASSADTLQVNVDGESYWLHEMGSGFAHFVMVLASAAQRDPSYILIDEPEQNLHPALQHQFLRALASYASQGVIFSTHSIGLARAAADRRYSIRRIDKGVSEIHDLRDTPALTEFLGELGFAGYRELGYDWLLLVEGQSDIKTTQEWLTKLGLERRIVVLDLGGSSQIGARRKEELVELTRLADNIAAVIDSERMEASSELSEPRQRFAGTCEELGIRLHVLDWRATENYLTDRAVKSALGGEYSAIGPYEALREAAKPWPKASNWKIARAMTEDELLDTDLGSFLQKIPMMTPE